MVHEGEVALGADKDGEALEVVVDGPGLEEVRMGIKHQDQALVISRPGLGLRVSAVPAWNLWPAAQQLQGHIENSSDDYRCHLLNVHNIGH